MGACNHLQLTHNAFINAGILLPSVFQQFTLELPNYNAQMMIPRLSRKKHDLVRTVLPMHHIELHLTREGMKEETLPSKIV